MKVFNQLKLIHSFDWDVLIILDACRYDFFAEEFKDTIKTGKLLKAISCGSDTVEWCTCTWTGFYSNLVYVSANPIINSLGVHPGLFRAPEHFSKIIDVWKFGWNENLKTIPPEKVKEAALKIGGRMVVHFMQPHRPHIIKKSGEPAFLKPREGRWEAMKDRYRNNVHYVLEVANDLINKLPQHTIIVTSDHGQLLGEDGLFGHPRGSDHPILREVPWLEIKRDANEEKVTERLRALGYIE